MNFIKKYFDKDVLAVCVVGCVISLTLVFFGKTIYYDRYGDVKFYHTLVSGLCGVFIFLFFLCDPKFKFKYYLGLVIINKIFGFMLGFLTAIFIEFGLPMNEALYFLIITAYIVIPMLYNYFKNISYNKIKQKRG